MKNSLADKMISIADKMISIADKDNLPADHQMRMAAHEMDNKSGHHNIKVVIGAWARARRVYCDYTGEDLV